MTPRYWLEVRNARKVALFAATVLLVGVFWWALPDAAKVPVLRHRGVVSLPAAMFALWIGGWFLWLFARAEDLDLTSNFDYQTLTRVIAGFMIVLAMAIAAFFAIAFFV